jgi:hypothetical protein
MGVDDGDAIIVAAHERPEGSFHYSCWLGQAAAVVGKLVDYLRVGRHYSE